MAKTMDTYEQLQKAYKTRIRTTPFIEGIYQVRVSFFFFFRPRITFHFNKKGTKAKASLSWWHIKKTLKRIKSDDKDYLFRFMVDIIDIDLVIHFTGRDCFEGFFDTPIGHIPCKGHYIKRIYGE